MQKVEGQKGLESEVIVVWKRCGIPPSNPESSCPSRASPVAIILAVQVMLSPKPQHWPQLQAPSSSQTQSHLQFLCTSMGPIILPFYLGYLTSPLISLILPLTSLKKTAGSVWFLGFHTILAGPPQEIYQLLQKATKVVLGKAPSPYPSSHDWKGTVCNGKREKTKQLLSL